MRIRFIIPGDIDTPTGGYRYDRAIIEEWRAAGIDVDLVSLEGSYPFPTETEIQRAHQSLNTMAPADIAVIDGLAGGVLPDFIKEMASSLPVAALIHHPLFLENGLSPSEQESLHESEKKGLDFVSAVVTTSPATTRTVADVFQFPAEKIFTVVPGVERGPVARGSGTDKPNILCVGTISERKGHDVLIHALSKIKDLAWHLDIVGSTAFNPELLRNLQNQVARDNLSERVIFHGAVDEDKLAALYLSADIFALASRFEGYGMVYSEAIVRGLPVLGTTAGAIPDTVPASCGILVEPDDIDAFAGALRQILCDPNARKTKKQGAIAAEPDFATWQSSAELFLQSLRSVL